MIVISLFPAARAAVLAQVAADLDVAVVARAVRPGEVVRVDVTCACGATAPQVSAFGRGVPVAPSPDGTRWQALVGIDLDTTPGTYPLVVQRADRQPALVHERALRVEPQQFRTRTLRVAPEYVDPPADQIERLLREAALLEDLFNTVTPRAWDRPFVLPLSTSPTANFGSRSIFNGEPRSPHAGIDFSSPTGTAVMAPAVGRVALAADLFFTGNTVVVDHGGGLYSLFAHLSSMAVQAGDAVTRGSRLGRVGATGRATGPHLHWSIRLNGARVDPLSLIVATEDGPRR